MIARPDRRRSAQRYRMAEQAVAILTPTTEERNVLPSSQVAWQELNRLQRLLILSQARKLEFAPTRIRERAGRAIQDIHSELRRVSEKISTSEQRHVLVKDVYNELTALETDFENVTLDPKSRVICATTEAIELEGEYLGAFKIQLELKHLSQSNPYRVIAVDPHPASSCDSTVHPHCDAETLCEGHGQRPIAKALSDGRIYDFFVIVHQILNTYNSHSAYVTLRDWGGVRCSDCDYISSEDHAYSCSKCEETICDDCVSSCDGCSENDCSPCVTACAGCQDDYCNGCLSNCFDCDDCFLWTLFNGGTMR